MKKMYLWQIGIYGIVAAVAAIFWIQYVVVGAKEVAIRYGYEQYYFHLFAARPLLYFALGALGVTVLQWEREHASRTPRSAQQFIKYLKGL